MDTENVVLFRIQRHSSEHFCGEIFPIVFPQWKRSNKLDDSPSPSGRISVIEHPREVEEKEGPKEEIEDTNEQNHPSSHRQHRHCEDRSGLESSAKRDVPKRPPDHPDWLALQCPTGRKEGDGRVHQTERRTQLHAGNSLFPPLKHPKKGEPYKVLSLGS